MYHGNQKSRNIVVVLIRDGTITAESEWVRVPGGEIGVPASSRLPRKWGLSVGAERLVQQT